MIVKGLTAKLQNKFHVSAAEADGQDTHQMIAIGAAAIVPHNAMADSLMGEDLRVRGGKLRSGDTGRNPRNQITGGESQWMHWKLSSPEEAPETISLIR